MYMLINIFIQGVHKVCVQYEILISMLLYLIETICENKNKKETPKFIVMLFIF